MTLRRIGLIGGISWAATADYYRHINLDVLRRLGGNHSADMIIRSLDLHPLLEHAEDLQGLEQIFHEAGRSLHAGGADVIAIASFTGHRFKAGLTEIPLPLIDIVTAIGAHVGASRIKRLAVWSTSYSLRDPALMHRLSSACSAELIVPPDALHAEMDRIIFSELARQNLQRPSISLLRHLMERHVADGAQALLLATTDLSPLASLLGSSLPILDATEIHCAAITHAAFA